MAHAKQFNKGLVICFLLSAVILSSLSVVVAAENDPARMLPADTFLYLVVPEGIPTIQEKFKKTAWWALYKESAMQQFIAPAEKALREKINEELKKGWKQLEIDEPPEQLPWPTGRMVLAMRMGIKTRQVPEYDFENMEESFDDDSGDAPQRPKIKGTRDVKEPTSYYVAILDMGQNMDALKIVLERSVDKAIEKGSKRQRETVRGLEMEILTPLAPEERPEGMPEDIPFTPDKPDPFCYAFSGQTALFSSDPQLLKDVLARMAGAETDSLADNVAMDNTLRALGAPGDACFYLNIDSLIKSLKATAAAEEQQEVDKVIQALGFDNVVGLGLVAQLAPSDVEEFRLKGFLAINGPKRGIPAILTPSSGSTTGHRLLTRGLQSFSVANYDPEKVYNGIAQIVQAIAGQDMDMIVQQMMAATAMNDPQSRPPVDLHKEIISQLDSPLTVMTQINKPYTDPQASRTLVALGVRDPAVLDTALGRVHQVLLARGNKELRRELLGTNIYILQGGPMLGGLMMGMPPGEPQSEKPSIDDSAIALAVTGSNLVIGRIPTVEQAIRDLRRTDLEPIQTDPMYSYVGRFLPAQAGLWSYENYQTAAELIWTQLKAAARKAAEEPAGSEGETDEEAFGLAFGSIFGATGFPAKEMVKSLKGVCDFTTLPDFQAVQKYFGAAVSYFEGTDDGLRFEAVIIKAPPAP